MHSQMIVRGEKRSNNVNNEMLLPHARDVVIEINVTFKEISPDFSIAFTQ